MDGRWVRPALMALLLVEAVGALAVAVLTVTIGGSITPGFIPWSSAAMPAGFGIVTLGVAVWWWRRRPGGRGLVAALQVVVVIGAATVLVSSPDPATVAGLLLGLAGLVLVAIDARRGRRSHPLE
jgi:hypothetical protein